jgi:hypothetical protein
VCLLTLLNVTSAKPNFTSWNYLSVSFRHDRVAFSFGIKQIRYLENIHGEVLHWQFRSFMELHKKHQQMIYLIANSQVCTNQYQFGSHWQCIYTSTSFKRLFHLLEFDFRSFLGQKSLDLNFKWISYEFYKLYSFFGEKKKKGKQILEMKHGSVSELLVFYFLKYIRFDLVSIILEFGAR